MKITIRQLQQDDLNHVKSMETGIVDDYLIRVYHRVSKDASRLYGLFVDNHLASIGGYTIFEEHYIMLGRMRSDLRFPWSKLFHTINDSYSKTKFCTSGYSMGGCQYTTKQPFGSTCFGQARP